MIARRIFHRLVLLAALAAPIASAFAQVPPPVPGMPDSPRQTTYTISGTNCSCSVGFDLYGDSTDFQSWVEIWLNGKLVQYNDPTFGWTLSTSSPGGFASTARPILNGVLTFNSVQTGTVVIVGAQRPRRNTVYQEGAGVTARAHNQALNTIFSELRENWDKTNDITGRGLFGAPGSSYGPLPLPSACINSFLQFDATGLIPICALTNPAPTLVVTSFNSRTNVVTLTSADVTTALAYNPMNPANNLSDLNSVAVAATNLGLGTASAVQFASLKLGSCTLGGNLFCVNGNVSVAGNVSVTAGSGFVAGANGYSFNTGSLRGYFTANADGVFEFTNNAGTDFNRLQFGGTTSSFPALFRVGTRLAAVLADNSAVTNFEALTFYSNGVPGVTCAAGTINLTTAAAAGGILTHC